MSEKNSINNYLSSWDGLSRLNFAEYKFVKSNLKNNNSKILPNELVINYKILGSSKVLSMQENIFPNLISTSTNNDFVKREPNYSSISSLIFDNDKKKIF